MTKKNPGPAWLLPFFSLTSAELLSQLGTDAEQGLSSTEASARLLRYGANELEAHATLSALRLLWKQVSGPLMWILLIAALVSSLAGEWTDALVITAIVVASTGISFFREYGAGLALESLKARITLRTTVLRDGVTREVPARELVPGDIVLLRAGSLIPADGVLLVGTDFFVSQAVLTGETFPVEKKVGPSAPETPLAERLGALYLGTHVRSGIGRMLVCATGPRTAYGAIAERLRLRPPETEFERGLRHFGYLLTIAMLLLTFIVLAFNLLYGKPGIESLLFSVALAVGLAPELLPAILSANLSRSAGQMAKAGVLVRRLNSIENLGAMDVLCSDKTGTLTEGVVRLDGACDESGAASARVAELAWLNAKLQGGIVNPLDDAIIRSADIDLSFYEKAGEIPYDFLRKRLGTIVKDTRQGTCTLIVKGALESVLDVCADMSAERRAALCDRLLNYSREGFRVLGVASRPIVAKESYRREDEAGLEFAGFLLFLDPPKKGINQVLSDFASLGISVKIITGDNSHVARHIAESIGLSCVQILTGRELDALRDEALWHKAEKTDIFAEVDPNQKERIILALKKTNHVVGYMGDGINDAPALHAADVSISVEGAVDVAKEAADLVLLRRDFEVLGRGVRLGRATFANTLKYILMSESANLGNMLSMAAASLFLPFFPLLASQILLNNFLSDLPAFALSLDRVDKEWISRPHRWDMGVIRRFMVQFGVLSSVFDFLTFGLLLYVVHATPVLFRASWFTESVLTELAVTMVVRTRLPFFRSRPSTGLLLTSASVALFVLALPYLPVARPFGLVPIPLWLLAAMLAITALYVGAAEVLKQHFVKREPRF